MNPNPSFWAHLISTKCKVLFACVTWITWPCPPSQAYFKLPVTSYKGRSSSSHGSSKAESSHRMSPLNCCCRRITAKAACCFTNNVFACLTWATLSKNIFTTMKSFDLFWMWWIGILQRSVQPVVEQKSSDIVKSLIFCLGLGTLLTKTLWLHGLNGKSSSIGCLSIWLARSRNEFPLQKLTKIGLILLPSVQLV